MAGIYSDCSTREIIIIITILNRQSSGGSHHIMQLSKCTQYLTNKYSTSSEYTCRRFCQTLQMYKFTDLIPAIDHCSGPDRAIDLVMRVCAHCADSRFRMKLLVSQIFGMLVHVDPN